MDIRPIKTEADYLWALAEVEAYFDIEPAPGSPDADRFDILSDLIEVYERRRFSMSEVDPIEALRSFMEDAGRTQTELAELLGSAPRASEILNRKRALTIEMIDAISRAWRMPIELLARPYRLRSAA